ncbi:MAG: heavy metal-binding domain-containing protein [Hyphomicrobiaceae bacterium]
MPLITIERPARPVAEGGVVHAVVFRAANIVRDVREHITNTFGGRMRRYEALTEEAIAEALAALEEKARAAGYDGVMGVRIEHPRIVDGGVGVVAYGTGFHYVSPGPAE